MRQDAAPWAQEVPRLPKKWDRYRFGLYHVFKWWLMMVNDGKLWLIIINLAGGLEPLTFIVPFHIWDN